MDVQSGLHMDRCNRCLRLGNEIAVFAERIHMHEDCFTYQFFDSDLGIRRGDTTG